MLTQLSVEALKNINLSYQGKYFPILDLLYLVKEYVLYCEKKIEKYKTINYKKAKIKKMNNKTQEIIK